MKFTRRTLLGAAAVAAPALIMNRQLFAADNKMKAAIVMPGPITDHGWSQAGYEAMQVAGEKLGIETAFAEKVAQPDHVEAMSDFARRGFTHVIGHGGEFQDAVDRVAARFTDTRFIVTNGLH